MAESAARIPAAEPPGLDPERQAEFRELATAFEEASRRLAEDAPNLSPRGLRARLDEIDATCDRCHGRFRIPGVDGGGR
jgi:cytochrome c556